MNTPSRRDLCRSLIVGAACAQGAFLIPRQACAQSFTPKGAGPSPHPAAKASDIDAFIRKLESEIAMLELQPDSVLAPGALLMEREVAAALEKFRQLEREIARNQGRYDDVVESLLFSGLLLAAPALLFTFLSAPVAIAGASVFAIVTGPTSLSLALNAAGDPEDPYLIASSWASGRLGLIGLIPEVSRAVRLTVGTLGSIETGVNLYLMGKGAMQARTISQEVERLLKQAEDVDREVKAMSRNPDHYRKTRIEQSRQTIETLRFFRPVELQTPR